MKKLKAWANGKWPSSALEDDLWEAALEIEAMRKLIR